LKDGNKNSLAGVSFTPGWTTEQEGHLTVGNGLLGKIIVDDDGVLSIITEVFACNMVLLLDVDD
jgi:hypothetical protein